MNTKSFNAGFALVNSTVEFVKHLPTGFCHVGQGAKNAGSAVTSFLAGMKQAIKFHTGKCKLVAHKKEG